MQFENLIVWQKSHQLVLNIYQRAKDFPKSELYALGNQIRRAAVSIPANIAEGHLQPTPKNKLKYLFIAKGSLNEVKYYNRLCLDLGYYSHDQSFGSELSEIEYLLNAYIKAIIIKSTK